MMLSSFSSEPYGGDADVRTTYCAFAISSMLDDWSGVRIEPALRFIAACRSYEGGYGQVPFAEAAGGPTYCALASIFLAGNGSCLTSDERKQTIRWLTQNQVSSGGYSGRTNKEADACYCFWCGASLSVLGAREFVCEWSLSKFIASCQFKFGGISKAPQEHPDPYHTYLSLAAVAMYPPLNSAERSWVLQPLDPLLNANEATSNWARNPTIKTFQHPSMALNGFEESTAWAISNTETGDIVKDAIRKEKVLKYVPLIPPLVKPVQKQEARFDTVHRDVTAAQSDLRALVTRVRSVQADVEKLTSENATLQMYIDNLTMQMARRK
ncbi:terpenoid cyclases/protein prenyltransferase alpha-alpha toroid [Lanmaoa asiatica]|nr:terpenoid cyclases/protein prenyltransferase alpha-alpha toroid [Lanmaoa asiatica]